MDMGVTVVLLQTSARVIETLARNNAGSSTGIKKTDIHEPEMILHEINSLVPEELTVRSGTAENRHQSQRRLIGSPITMDIPTGTSPRAPATAHLRRMLQDPTTKKEWMGITDILCAVPGPLQKFAADMDHIVLTYPSSFMLRSLDSLGMSSKDQKELAEIKASVESLKGLLIFALRNDPM